MNRLGINDLRSEAKEQEQRSEIWEELFLYLVCIKTTYQAIAIDKDNFTKYSICRSFFVRKSITIKPQCKFHSQETFGYNFLLIGLKDRLFCI